MRRRATAMLFAALLPALLLVAPGSAGADRHGAGGDRQAPVYLALGDSVAFGVGAVPERAGYVQLLADELRARLRCTSIWLGGRCRSLELRNLADPGATTSSLIAEQLPVAHDVLAARNHDRDERDDVRVVTVTIGGNDAFGPVIGACVTGEANCQDTVDAVLAGYRANLTLILGRLRAAAGPETTIVTTAYYNPLPACFLAQVAPLGDVVLEGGALPAPFDLEVSEGLNDITEAVSATVGARVADAYGALGQQDFVGGADCLHPDASGHERLAEIFADVIL